jgi:RNA polymerase sigma factor (sigma-70 family)
LIQNPKILAAYREGQKEGLDAVYHEYVDSVTTLIRCGFSYSKAKTIRVKGILDPELQRDLVQETFMRAFSKTARKNYNGTFPFELYIHRIAKNLMIDRLRRSNREVLEVELQKEDHWKTLEHIVEPDFSILEENPSDYAHLERQQQACKKYIAGLSKIEQEFYQLRYIDELSQDQVGAKMALTRGKIRTLENNIRRGLKKFLKKNKLWP